MVKCLQSVNIEGLIYTEPSTGKMMNFDYSEEYLWSISNQSFIMTVFRKVISYSLDIYRMIKNQCYAVHKIYLFLFQKA